MPLKPAVTRRHQLAANRLIVVPLSPPPPKKSANQIRSSQAAPSPPAGSFTRVNVLKEWTKPECVCPVEVGAVLTPLEWEGAGEGGNVLLLKGGGQNKPAQTLGHVMCSESSLLGALWVGDCLEAEDWLKPSPRFTET